MDRVVPGSSACPPGIPVHSNFRMCVPHKGRHMPKTPNKNVGATHASGRHRDRREGEERKAMVNPQYIARAGEKGPYAPLMPERLKLCHGLCFSNECVPPFASSSCILVLGPAKPMVWRARVLLTYRFDSALTMPLQCPYSALTVPFRKNHSALTFLVDKGV